MRASGACVVPEGPYLLLLLVLYQSNFFSGRCRAALARGHGHPPERPQRPQGAAPASPRGILSRPGPSSSPPSSLPNRQVTACRLHSSSLTAESDPRPRSASLCHLQEAVRCVTAAPGGRVVSGSVDTTLRVWSVAAGRKIHKLKGHSAPVRALAAFTLGEGGASLVASASDDGSIRVWDIDAGTLQFALQGALLQRRLPLTSSVARARLRNTGGLPVSAVRCADRARAAPPHPLAGHSGPVSAICLLPGNILVSGSWDRLVVVWRARLCRGGTLAAPSVLCFPYASLASCSAPAL